MKTKDIVRYLGAIALILGPFYIAYETIANHFDEQFWTGYRYGIEQSNYQHKLQHKNVIEKNVHEPQFQEGINVYASELEL